MEECRDNSQKLLKEIQEEGKEKQRGHLKIFFGYAAGVGKTYAMLKAAHEVKKSGIDVVVGYVEPHMRPQTAGLLDGLEQMKPLMMEYKGITLREFDLDGALARCPKLILVDELAHSNGAGCRHAKRYRDISELLKAGIDVYTTVNVQHIESLNDIVASITGVNVQERIPDLFFDEADQVKLVDIEPEELIERLNTGNIYKEDQAKKALHNFFGQENLIALREIALRRCADRVNLISEKARHLRGNDYYTDEHILVCLSSSPTNPKIIRTAARMAAAFHGGFTALFVETSDFEERDDEDKKRLERHIKLASDLGASIEAVTGDHVAFQIAEFSRIAGVSKVVMGRNTVRKRYFFGRPSLVEQLTNLAPNLDIHIIPDKNTPRFKGNKNNSSGPFLWSDFAKSIGLLAGATAIGFLFWELGFSEANIITVYILSVLLTAVATSKKSYSIISSAVSVLIFNFFFTDPRFTLNAYDSGYPVTFLIMFISAFITSSLAVKIKKHATQSAHMAYHTKILLETNQMLQQQKEKDGILKGTMHQLVRLLNLDILYLDEKEGKLLEPVVFPKDERVIEGAYLTENEKAVAAWVFKNNKRAGATTNTLGNSRCLYLAVRSKAEVYGVVGIAVENKRLNAFENSILLSILGECALALENRKISLEREQVAVLAKNEQLRANLLRAISHDLRTPLTSISGNAGILLSAEEGMSLDKRRHLYGDIYDDSMWLINLVENLLSVTKIEDGTMHLNLHGELMDEVLEEALRHISRRRAEHEIIIENKEEFQMAKMDGRLIVQVIINMLDNAIKYTPKGSVIKISAYKEDKMMVVEVADNGPGIPEEAKGRIFDMFYRVENKVADSRRSLGLGLSLCKSIIQAHQGEIMVEDNVSTGTIFRFTLPAEEVEIHE